MLFICLFFPQETLDALVKSEYVTDEIKTQLNDLCRFTRDLSTHSSKVSGLIKEYNRYTFVLFIVHQSWGGHELLLGNS